MKNIGRILEEHGYAFDDLVNVTVWLADIEDYHEMNEAYASYFDERFPARACTGGAQIVFDFRVEIAAIAHRDNDDGDHAGADRGLVDRAGAGPPRLRMNASPFPPTRAGIGFGPHERDLMAVWLAESADPVPAVLCFHPGCFRKLARPGPVRTAPPVVRRDLLALVDAGISIVAPSHHGAGWTPFEGAARALQFVRAKAGEWNLDKERIAAMGTSSGACLSLWLAAHADLADPASEDPVARESTRLACAAVNQAVTSVDPRFMRGSDAGICRPRPFPEAVSTDWRSPIWTGCRRRPAVLMEELSPVNHVRRGISPTLLTYDDPLDAPYGIHHPSFGVAWKERDRGRREPLRPRGPPAAGGGQPGDDRSPPSSWTS